MAVYSHWGFMFRFQGVGRAVLALYPTIPSARPCSHPSSASSPSSLLSFFPAFSASARRSPSPRTSHLVRCPQGILFPTCGLSSLTVTSAFISFYFIILSYLASLPFPFCSVLFCSVLFCFILFLGLIGSWALQRPPRCSRNVYKRKKRFRDAERKKGPG